eukprot:1159338-Pelagomonas_calceolata.AAC.15
MCAPPRPSSSGAGYALSLHSSSGAGRAFSHHSSSGAGRAFNHHSSSCAGHVFGHHSSFGAGLSCSSGQAPPHAPSSPCCLILFVPLAPQDPCGLPLCCSVVTPKLVGRAW